MALRVAVLPDGLARMAPGPGLTACLAGLLPDLAAVADEDTATVSGAADRAVNHARAVQLAARLDPALRASAEAAEGRPVPDRSSVALVGLIAALTDRAASYEVAFAWEVIVRLPMLHAAMLAGDLDERRARVFTMWTLGLPDDLARELCERLLAWCFDRTTSQIKDRIGKVAAALDPGYVQRRYEAALRRCNVTGGPEPDGTASVNACHLPPAEAAAFLGRLNTLARAAKRAGDPRRIGHLRWLLNAGLVNGDFTGTDSAILAALAETRPGPAEQAAEAAEEATARDRADHLRADTRAAHDRMSKDIRSARRRTSGDGRSDDGWPDDDGPEDGGTGDGPDDDGRPDHDGWPDKDGPDDQPDDQPGGGAAGPDDDSRPGGIEGPRSDGSTGAAGPSRGTTPGRVSGTGVHVSARLSTLLGRDDHPGDLAGHGALTAAETRRLVHGHATAAWRWALTDATGHLLDGDLLTARPPGYPPREQRDRAAVDLLLPAALLADLLADPNPGNPGDPALALWLPVLGEIDRQRTAGRAPPDETRRFPTAGLRRLVQLDTPTCAWPTCATPAEDSEVDHTTEHARHGPTTRRNLRPWCPKHHALKTGHGWTARATGPHAYTLTSPIGTLHHITLDPILEPLPDPSPSTEPFTELRLPEPDWRTDVCWNGPRRN